MRYITDAMLGKLTRWLRLAGQDTKCVNDLSLPSDEEDHFLLEKASEESRVLITRDIDLHRRALKKGIETVLIEDDDVPEQLAKISSSIDDEIVIEMGDSRCPVCNGELENVEPDSVKDDVSKKVLERNDRFWKCRNCGKIYWPGTHWEKIEKTIEKYEKIKG